jgi:hypothetical protein
VKRKLGTVMEESLLWRAKQVAAREKKPSSALLEEALDAHLARLEETPGKRPGHVVEDTRGTLRVSKKIVNALLAEEGFFEAR